MKRPTNNIVFLSCSLVIALFLAGFITAEDGKLSFSKHDGPEKALVSAESLMAKVLELNNQKRHQESIELLMSALENKSDDPMLRSLLLQTFDMFLQDEIRRGQQDVRSNPNDVEAYARVSTAFDLMGDQFRAAEILLNGIMLNPQSPILWMKIGKLELKANRPMEALDVFKEVIRLEPHNSDALNNAAFLLSQAQNIHDKDLLTAETFAQNARTIDPKNPEYIDTLAEVQFRKGNQKLAQSLIKQAIELAPDKAPFELKLKKFSTEQSLPLK